MRGLTTRRRVLAGISVASLSALAGCPSGDSDTTEPPSTPTSTATSTTPTPTSTPTPAPPSTSDELLIPAGETHTIGAEAVESYVSVEWGEGAGLVIESGGTLELTPST